MCSTKGHARVDSAVLPGYSTLSDDAILPDLSVSIALPASLHLLAKAYGVPESDILHLAWALVLRSFLGTPSVFWSTVDHQKQSTGRSAHALKWECLELNEHHAISWVLRKWQDPSVHRYLSPYQLPGDQHQIPATMMLIVKEYAPLEALSPTGCQVSENPGTAIQAS